MRLSFELLFEKLQFRLCCSFFFWLNILALCEIIPDARFLRVIFRFFLYLRFFPPVHVGEDVENPDQNQQKLDENDENYIWWQMEADFVTKRLNWGLFC